MGTSYFLKWTKLLVNKKFNHHYHIFYWLSHFKYKFNFANFVVKINIKAWIYMYMYTITYCSLAFSLSSSCWWSARSVILRCIESSLSCISFWAEAFNCLADKTAALISSRIWAGKNCSLWRKILACMVSVSSLSCIFRLASSYSNFIKLVICQRERNLRNCKMFKENLKEQECDRAKNICSPIFKSGVCYFTLTKIAYLLGWITISYIVRYLISILDL